MGPTGLSRQGVEGEAVLLHDHVVLHHELAVQGHLLLGLLAALSKACTLGRGMPLSLRIQKLWHQCGHEAMGSHGSLMMMMMILSFHEPAGFTGNPKNEGCNTGIWTWCRWTLYACTC